MLLHADHSLSDPLSKHPKLSRSSAPSVSSENRSDSGDDHLDVMFEPMDPEPQKLHVNHPGVGGIREHPFPLPPHTFGSGETRWEHLWAESDPNNPYFPWAGEVEYELVSFLAQSGLSQASIDKLLKTAYVFHFTSMF